MEKSKYIILGLIFLLGIFLLPTEKKYENHNFKIGLSDDLSKNLLKNMNLKNITIAEDFQEASMGDC